MRSLAITCGRNGFALPLLDLLLVRRVPFGQQGFQRCQRPVELFLVERLDLPEPLRAGAVAGRRRVEDVVEPAPRFGIALVLHQARGDQQRDVEEQLPVVAAERGPMVEIDLLGKQLRVEIVLHPVEIRRVCRLEVERSSAASAAGTGSAESVVPGGIWIEQSLDAMPGHLLQEEAGVGVVEAGELIARVSEVGARRRRRSISGGGIRGR